MKETKPRKKYYKAPERHMPRTITKTVVKQVPAVIYVLDEEEAPAAYLRNKEKKNAVK